ncbi:LOW QUALITY PROTEIN: hypothetical protein TorRG33x02_048660 [Trema orientale]|uniref:Uncharacterized protein n=1 Tax=Trema orientale TaxID=63057 RepID=A0A2P5FNL0_TREOI|nr:LOW QUALITY PROTEIN: hypothetical protein TorRG33x02_048660 [Trema orientale]
MFLLKLLIFPMGKMMWQHETERITTTKLDDKRGSRKIKWNVDMMIAREPDIRGKRGSEITKQVSRVAKVHTFYIYIYISISIWPMKILFAHFFI